MTKYDSMSYSFGETWSSKHGYLWMLSWPKTFWGVI